MGCRGTTYVPFWDMPATASPSLTFIDLPFNESICFFEVGARFHLGSLSPAHLGTASSAPNLIKTRRPPAISDSGPTPNPPPRPLRPQPPSTGSRALEAAVSWGNTNRSGPNLRRPHARWVRRERLSTHAIRCEVPVNRLPMFG